MKNREAKTEENVKTAMFIRGSKTSQVVNDALADLVSLCLFSGYISVWHVVALRKAC